MSETVEYPPATEQDSHLLTVLIADIRGYSTYTHEHGDEAGARLASSFADLAGQVISTSGGRLLELRGDEALAVFPSARRAARAAIELQARCAETVEADPSLPLRVGVGLDAGEVVPVGGGYRGRALNVAARLCSLAKPGEILVGEGLVHIAGAVDGLAFVPRGRPQLKGIERVRVYQLGREGELPDHLPPITGGKASAPKAPSRPASAVVAIVAAGFGLAGILIELLVSTYTAGFVVGIVIAGLACVAAFATSRPIAGQEIQGVPFLYLIVAFALVFVLHWWAAVSAVLFLIAAGVAFFGDSGSPPASPPP